MSVSTVVPAYEIDTLSPLKPKAKPPLPVMAVPSTCSMALRMVGIAAVA
ncbi:hypothetical protein [Streptomyces hokutonensis]